MLIGQRLRDIRKDKNFSQDDIAKATGFMRPYISRIENGHTVPSVESLQKWAQALGMALYQILYESEDGPPQPWKPPSKVEDKLWGSSGREVRQLDRLRRLLAKMEESDRNTFLAFAARVARRSWMK